MNIKPIQFMVIVYALSLIPMAAHSAPVAYGITATVAGSNVSGSYTASFSDGDTIQGTFISDTDEANASWEDISNVDELLYDFQGFPYGVWVNNINSSYSFIDDTAIVVDVVNNIVIDQGTSDDLGGLITPGTYDVVGMFGHTTDEDGLNGEEWGINFIADDTWFNSNGGIPDIPGSLPSGYDILLTGEEFDGAGSIGRVNVLASVDSVSAVPIPAAVWLFGSGLIGLIGIARRKKA